ncbi:MAG: hypothetical protein PXY39_15250, partial [archaeon]|nr:hypothetical protein [archaeon]
NDTVSFASNLGVEPSRDFVSSLRVYFKTTSKNIPKIEKTLNSKVAPEEVTLAFRTIGHSAVRLSHARKSKVVTKLDLQKALDLSKKVGLKTGLEVAMICPLPDCWGATASLIDRNRRLLSED